ncbi:Late embryogenesis abundant protein [Tenacibaculum sp. 190524A02b]|uniref:Late embryogenesis abundant protein n=1 Tax=Tenacibaculum vairaonense TaxID=3137860 RepID=A0ABM9PGM5_9FLAO
MKNVICFLSVIFLVSCTVKEKPIFLKVDDVEFLSMRADTLKIGANAYFENPNDIGGKIATDGIKVIVDGVEVAEVFSEEFKVPAKKEFALPLKVVIPTKKVFENNKNGVLGGIISSLLSQRLKIQLKGDLKYKVLGFSHTYTIDKTEELKIKL